MFHHLTFFHRKYFSISQVFPTFASGTGILGSSSNILKYCLRHARKCKNNTEGLRTFHKVQ